jgi:hypothetical protein
VAGSSDLTTADAPSVRKLADVQGTWPVLQKGERLVPRAVHGTEVLLSRQDRDGEPAGLVIKSTDGRPDQDVASHEGSVDPVMAANFDEEHVAWMESSTVDLGVIPWVLYVADRSTGTVSRLAESPRIEGREPPGVPGYTGPVLIGDQVFWAQVGGTVGAEVVDIYQCDIDDCAPTVVVKEAAFPAVAGGRLYFVTGSRYSAAQTAKGGYGLGSFNPTTNAKRRVRPIDTAGKDAPNGLAVGGDHAVITVTTAGSGHVEIVDLKTEDVVTVEPDGTGLFVYPKATSRFAAWADGNSGQDTVVGGYLYDYATGSLYAVGDTPGLYNIQADDNLLVWQETDPSAGVINVAGTID